MKNISAREKQKPTSCDRWYGKHVICHTCALHVRVDVSVSACRARVGVIVHVVVNMSVSMSGTGPVFV